MAAFKKLPETARDVGLDLCPTPPASFVPALRRVLKHCLDKDEVLEWYAGFDNDTRKDGWVAIAGLVDGGVRTTPWAAVESLAEALGRKSKE